MLKLFLFFLCLALIYMYRREVTAKHQNSATEKSTPKQIQTIKECAYCALNVPEVEGVYDGDIFYCSEDHRLQARAKL